MLFDKGVRGRPSLVHTPGPMQLQNGGKKRRKYLGRTALYEKAAHDVSGESRDERGRWTAAGAAVESATSRAMRDLPVSAEPHRGVVRDALASSLHTVSNHIARLGRTVVSVIPQKIRPVRGGGLQFSTRIALDNGQAVSHVHQIMPHPLDATAGALGAAALGVGRYGSRIPGVAAYAAPAAGALGVAGGAAEAGALGIRGLNAALVRAGYKEQPATASHLNIGKSASGDITLVTVAKGFHGDDVNQRWLGRQGVSGRRYA